MSNDQKIKVGISIGDLNGIGPEVILKTLSEPMMLDFCTPIIFASAKTISFYKKQLGLDLNVHGIDAFAKAIEGKVNVMNVWKENVSIVPGEATQEAGTYAIKSLKAAVNALKDKSVDVLVTAPINKANIQAADFKYPGHTDFIAAQLDGKAMMLMTAENLKVGLLTDHVPVKEVSQKITASLIEEKVATLYQTLQSDFGRRQPKIAILGINPHVGDNGVIGDEDDTVMIPTLEKIRAQGKTVYGPYAADSFFGTGNYKNFDAIIAAYHDQGLVPFKTLAFGQGVNFTAGLSRIRTSPDHGTAYEIAGKNQADPSSFRAAMFEAITIFKKRKEWDQLTENVLEVTKGRSDSRNKKNSKFSK